MKSDLLAQIAGRYQIERQLGEGRMGIVYAATDLRLHRPVALKRVRRGAEDTIARDRLKREARTAAAITHGRPRGGIEIRTRADEQLYAPRGPALHLPPNRRV